LNVAYLIGEAKVLAVNHALARSTLNGSSGGGHGAVHQAWRGVMDVVSRVAILNPPSRCACCGQTLQAEGEPCLCMALVNREPVLLGVLRSGILQCRADRSWLLIPFVTSFSRFVGLRVSAIQGCSRCPSIGTNSETGRSRPSLLPQMWLASKSERQSSVVSR
jgi:hypothetical protein